VVGEILLPVAIERCLDNPNSPVRIMTRADDLSEERRTKDQGCILRKVRGGKTAGGRRFPLQLSLFKKECRRIAGESGGPLISHAGRGKKPARIENTLLEPR